MEFAIHAGAQKVQSGYGAWQARTGREKRSTLEIAAPVVVVDTARVQ
ncbi:MAG TPA: hypothetical protein VE954_10220 [Oligoflexus sp.]|nr:hypothetical protein [Oligoflexus sp.]HYX33478.1 hypothetical protein [Oligoflexus sp.]